VTATIVPRTVPTARKTARELLKALDPEWIDADPEVIEPERDEPYWQGEASLFRDIAKAGADAHALDRLAAWFGEKAGEYSETDAAGGFLLNPQLLPVESRPVAPPLRAIFPALDLTTKQVEIPRWVDPTNTADWLAELANIPQLTQAALTSVLADAHTAAAYSVASRQLVEDSNADQLINDQLTFSIESLVEPAIINGSGTNRPLGLLQTPGVQVKTFTQASPTAAQLLGQIIGQITDVWTNHLSAPTHILVHPITFYKVVTDPAAQGLFTLFPEVSLLGLRAHLSPYVPRNLGAGSNETRIIVLDARASLMLNRKGLAVVASEHEPTTNAWLTNKVVYRGLERVGFSAARRPASVSVLQGTGLINTSF
jgi:HK97 family phage major capsid protein